MKFVIIDRLTRARDNGEYLYRYIRTSHPEIEVYFGLHKKSPDWIRLVKDKFNLIDLSNVYEIKNKVTNCTHFLFSESNIGYNTVARFLDRSKTVFVYLNHGCYFQKNKVIYSPNHFDYMICGNKAEYDAVVFNAIKNKWNKNAYLLTGFPRMDVQVNRYEQVKTKNLVLIQPWWRENLTGWRIVESTNSINESAIKKLQNSDFVNGFNLLLNSSEFKELCQANNLEVVFKRHPVMEHVPGIFDVPDWIIDEPEETFIDLFARTKVYITDYSSNAWETANLGIPCMYFEPDYENLTKNCNRPEWCWNVKTDGLGPVAFSITEFLNNFKKLIKNNYILDQIYLDRRTEQIMFLKDSNNCERCLNKIMSLNKLKIDTKIKTTKPTKSSLNNDYYLYF